MPRARCAVLGIVAGYNGSGYGLSHEPKTEPRGHGLPACWTSPPWTSVDAATDNAGGLLAPMVEPRPKPETTGTMGLPMTYWPTPSVFRREPCGRVSSGEVSQVVVPEARQRFLKDPYHKDRFMPYDEHSDSFTCPTGTDARVRPHTACERSPVATVQTRAWLQAMVSAMKTEEGTSGAVCAATGRPGTRVPWPTPEPCGCTRATVPQRPQGDSLGGQLSPRQDRIARRSPVARRRRRLSCTRAWMLRRHPPQQLERRTS